MNRYSELEKNLKLNFKDKSILDNAFVHKSYLNEHKDSKAEHNERLEFLGDAVLELVVTDYLFRQYPDKGEGILTNWRSALVQGRNLAQIASELNLGFYLYLSRGEEQSGGRKKNYLLANTLEALIGATYLDCGYDAAKKFIYEYVLTRLGSILDQGLYIDSKSRFQEVAQEVESITPEYHMLKEEGPDHDKVFTMGAFLGETLIAEGKGSSKQNAEQDAAKNAIKAKNWENYQIKK